MRISYSVFMDCTLNNENLERLPVPSIFTVNHQRTVLVKHPRIDRPTWVLRIFLHRHGGFPGSLWLAKYFQGQTGVSSCLNYLGSPVEVECSRPVTPTGFPNGRCRLRLKMFWFETSPCVLGHDPRQNVAPAKLKLYYGYTQAFHPAHRSTDQTYQECMHSTQLHRHTSFFV
ncbi:hypothetical protein PISMIDRAFT_574517 [Pisolithus microcarpus 441]|uniref:Uncharacterized protein n=1 Tax=Pisolithus microcarpus 441 TaxID=765257 RepID=A0A0C9ZEF5_9AGAM|nr:hypothetical protein PISMIDRAFT_574517 [Pisolithus microcarpus 441]